MALGTDMNHGRASTYNHHGCRCPDCTEANRLYCQEKKQKRDPRDSRCPHGTPGGYSNWGCRCPECTKANSDDWRKWDRLRAQR